MVIRVTNIHPSGACPDRVAVDMTVQISFFEIDVTLMPAEDGSGRWGAWGQLANWISRPEYDLDWDAIESEAALAAEAVYPCPTGAITREEWEEN